MKKILLVLLSIILNVIVAKRKGYSRLERINIAQVLGSQRLMSNYVHCLLDKISCSRDAQELKNILPEALSTDCGKCSEQQRIISRQIIRFLITQRRGWWSQLEAKYDPEATYRHQIEAELKNDLKTTSKRPPAEKHVPTEDTNLKVARPKPVVTLLQGDHHPTITTQASNADEDTTLEN